MNSDSDSDGSERYFKFLDALRERGSVNMFGAGPVLRTCFGLSRSESNRVLADWMRTYGQRHGTDSTGTDGKEADRA